MVEITLCGTRDTPPPTADVGEPFLRRHTRSIASTAVITIIAAVAVLGYNNFRRRDAIDTLPAPAAGGEARAAKAPASTGTQERCSRAGMALGLCEPTPTVTHAQARQ